MRGYVMYLGLDLGKSGLRAAPVDPNGAVIRPYDTQYGG